MPIQVACRRRQRRFKFLDDDSAVVAFDFPFVGGEPCEAALNDISGSGLSFFLSRSLPSFEAGDSLRGVTLRAGSTSIEGDLLVMHVSYGADTGDVCGGLFFPHYDRGVRALQGLLTELQARPD